MAGKVLLIVPMDIAVVLKCYDLMGGEGQTNDKKMLAFAKLRSFYREGQSKCSLGIGS